MTTFRNICTVGGEKGGTGKSFFAKTVFELLINRGLTDSFAFFDSDRSNPDLQRIYGRLYECKYAIFSEGERFIDSANQVFNAALNKNVLVNLPSQVQPALHEWIEKNELFDLAAENNIKLVMFFVSDCGPDSLKLFKYSLQKLGRLMPHVFVKNYGRCSQEDWEPFDEDKIIQKLIKQYEVQVIEFPKLLGASMVHFIDRENLTFGEALESDGLDVMNKSRIRSFLKKAYAQIESTGYFSTEAG